MNRALRLCVLTDEVVTTAGVVLGNVRNRLERLEENRESFAMSRVAAVEHHYRLIVVVNVTVDVLSATHLYWSRDTNDIHRNVTKNHNNFNPFSRHGVQ